MHRASWGERAQNFHAEYALSQHVHVLAYLEAL